MTCPGCRGETATLTLQRTIGGPLTLDLCHHCDGIWFDAGEQFRLMPDSTLTLIKAMQANHQERRAEAGTRLLCPRCNEPLAETYDLCRDTRFRFYRCANHHGVFFRFVDFLRSQGLLHGLSDAEIDALKSSAQTLQCPNCGGPIAAHAQTCPHCGSPVTWLDEDYLARALRQLAEDAKTAR
jgi:Zn-finger nucleic acid-binding protein